MTLPSRTLPPPTTHTRAGLPMHAFDHMLGKLAHHVLTMLPVWWLGIRSGGLRARVRQDLNDDVEPKAQICNRK